MQCFRKGYGKMHCRLHGARSCLDPKVHSRVVPLSCQPVRPTSVPLFERVHELGRPLAVYTNDFWVGLVIDLLVIRI